MLRIACVAALAVVSISMTAPLCAQLSSLSNRVELGIGYGPKWSDANQRGPMDGASVSVRLGYLRKATPWGAEMAVDLGGSRPSAAGTLKEVGVMIGVTRRLSPQRTTQSTSGPFVLAGLTQTLVARNSRERFARLYGYTLGIGQRLSLGAHGVARVDVMYARDMGSDFEGRYYPGSKGVSVRLGLGARGVE